MKSVIRALQIGIHKTQPRKHGVNLTIRTVETKQIRRGTCGIPKHQAILHGFKVGEGATEIDEHVQMLLNVAAKVDLRGKRKVEYVRQPAGNIYAHCIEQKRGLAQPQAWGMTT